MQLKNTFFAEHLRWLLVCNGYLKHWDIFCKNENINTNIMLKHDLHFLAHLFKKGNKYSLISDAQLVKVIISTGVIVSYRVIIGL